MKSCSTCYRESIVRVGDTCWDCWSAVHRKPRAAAPLAGGLALVVRRPPRHPLQPLKPCCFACGETDPARGCHLCYRAAGEAPTSRPLPAAQVQVEPRERAA